MEESGSEKSVQDDDTVLVHVDHRLRCWRRVRCWRRRRQRRCCRQRRWHRFERQRCSDETTPKQRNADGAEIFSGQRNFFVSDEKKFFVQR